MGNNDYEIEYHELDALLLENNVKVLDNTRVVFESELGEKICLLGVDDVGLKRDRLDLALADCKEDGFRILISHNPDIINKMSGKEQISLVLSGHTHGGQIRLFPSKKYLKGGVYKHSNMTLLLVMGMEQRWFHFASEHLLKHILLRYAEGNDANSKRKI